jgi:hypothetical protein
MNAIFHIELDDTVEAPAADCAIAELSLAQLALVGGGEVCVTFD